MALFTLGGCMSAATTLLGNRTEITASTASLYANQAALDIFFAVVPQPSESIAVSSTTVNGYKIPMPTDAVAILSLSNISISPPDVLEPADPFEFDSASTTSSRPTRYSQFGDNTIELWPIPDSTYSLQMRYTSRPVTLSLTTATPSFDTRWGLAWTYRTTSLLGEIIKEPDTAFLYQQKYLAELASKPSDQALRQRNRTPGAMAVSLSWLNQNRESDSRRSEWF